MPKIRLEDPDRRELTLRALSGESPSKLASEYGISRSHVYKLKEEALEDYRDEREFWNEVGRLAKEERSG